MGLDSAAHSTPAPRPAIRTRLALASRGDALTPYLFEALERRFPVVGRIDAELTTAQRYQVAALTMRPGRDRWAERFYKSGAARRLRSGNAARQLRALDEQPDAVLQVHGLFDLPGAAAIVYVDCTHRQSAESWPAWNPLRGRALEEWFRREAASYAAAEHLFAFSGPTRDSLVLDYGVPPERVTIVGAGANTARLPEARTMTPDGPPTILFVGNDFVRKGGRVLLGAFRRVREAVPDARLQLVGTDPSVRPEPGVEVLGRIRDRDRITELYRGAAVLALPSFFDPYPLVLLEAMAFGVPVVASAQTGVPEMVDDGRTGLLTEPGDEDDLVAALLDVLRQPGAAAERAAAARAELEERFTWDAVVDRMTPALQALAGSGRS